MKDVSNRLGVDMLMSLMGGSKKTVHEVDTSEFMKRVRERAARDAAGFQNVRDPNCAGIMFAQFSRLALSTFRDAFLDVPDGDIGSVEAHIVDACLAGYLAAARLAAALHSAEALERCAREAADLAAPRAFSSVRVNGAETKKPYAFTKKNAEAMRCVVELAKSVGNALDEKSWTHVLVAASRYDKIHSAAAGFDEASLFGGAPEKEERCAKEKRSTPSTGAFGSPWKGGDMGALNAMNALNVSAAFKNSPTLANVFGGAGVFGGTNSSSSADESPFAHLKKRADGADSSVGAFGSPSSGARSVPGQTDAADVNGDEDENVEQNQNPFDDLDSPDFVPPSPAATSATPLDAVSSAHLVSSELDGDAVVSFTKALCTVSSFELLSSPPRVCSLAKLVEVAHANMDTRTRFVWSKMWAVMSAFFCDACCHVSSVEVAMYAADSLRQLATKFLEREELLNYSFQNEFLKPFVMVTRRSQSPAVREFIVRCAGSMIGGQAKNVKSGWKSVFAVLTLAASDARPTTAALAFEIVERVIREHFDRITETDPSVFTDCVDCLIAFTRYAKEDNGADGVVALNAVAFLRFCALKLADGAIGDLEKGVESAAGGDTLVGDGDADLRSKEIERAEKTHGVSRPVARARGATAFTEADAHVFYWFPLLKGLSDLTFDKRAEIRRSALEVLFDILDFHGERFSPGFWFEAYHKVLLPIFDRVRFDDEKQDEGEGEDSWVFHTTQRCLDLLVDLTAKRRERILTSENSRGKETLGALFDLFVSLCLTSSKKLASCGVGAMHRLLSSNAADALDEHGWSVAVDALARAMEATKPDVKSLLANVNDADGAFSRKSAASRCAARGETCALLAHAAAETYFARGAVLSAEALQKLVDALLSVATHASASSTERIEATDLIATRMSLLALEIESHRALLAVLLHLHAAHSTKTRNIRDEAEAEAEAVKASEGMRLFSDAQVACGASTRDALVQTAVGILDRFASRIESAETKPTCDSALTPVSFASAFAPLASDALRALARLDDDAFRAALFSPVNFTGDFDSSANVLPRDDVSGKDATRKETPRTLTGFAALTRLTSCASTPRPTRLALSDVFRRRVGPLLSRALRRDARA
uniref:Mon2/Sec7/BIG1-like HDS domain-containing protein n=1 Tax=Micromonas pusilla TaxID=38833 RepID=A0A7S0CS16_MICPS